jgi:SAM-dependent methyltransferase
MTAVPEPFDPTLFAELADLEAASFWFVARNRVIVWALRRFFPDASSFLEVGCGTGFVLSAIAQAFPNLALRATDLYPEALAFVRARVPTAEVWAADVRTFSVDQPLDIVGAFDVLEHVEEDERALRTIAAAVKPGGGAIFTVPQHEWLWSGFDDASHHVRRYRRGELERKITRSGLQVVHSTSFVSVLLPLLAASRFGRRRSDVVRELRRTRRINSMLDAVMRAEGAMLRLGMTFPAGGSRLVVARRYS